MSIFTKWMVAIGASDELLFTKTVALAGVNIITASCGDVGGLLYPKISPWFSAQDPSLKCSCR